MHFYEQRLSSLLATEHAIGLWPLLMKSLSKGRKTFARKQLLLLQGGRYCCQMK